jgi:hypothetical protein
MPASSLNRARLRVADHVRACAVDGQVILLDLRRSKYVGVGGTQSRALARSIDGWPGLSAEPDSVASAIDADTLASPLLAQGLVTRAPRAAPAPKSSSTVTLAEATRSLNAEDAVPRPRLGWRRVARVLQTSTATALQLRVRSLGSIADSVFDRMSTCRSDGSLSLDLLQEAVAAYMRLRLYVFSAHDRCLHDSLTLLRFLQAEGISPRWVIGVRTHPFGAHSWLQTGETVVNDQHEHVRAYHPILAV